MKIYSKEGAKVKNITLLLKLMGEAFKDERIFRNLTQRQIAEKVGCSESEYKAIEAGQKNMNLSLFLKICGSFENTKMRDLFENVGLSFDVDHKIGKQGNRLTYYMDYFQSEFEIIAGSNMQREKLKKHRSDSMQQSLFEGFEIKE